MMPMLRRIHRWVTTLAVILLAYVSVTGCLLGLDSVKIWYDGGYPGAPKPTLLGALGLEAFAIKNAKP